MKLDLNDEGLFSTTHPTETLRLALGNDRNGAKPEAVHLEHELPLSADSGHPPDEGP